MFMYELIALHFPFEKQNLMAAQIEKLVVEGSRPQLQHRVCTCAEAVVLYIQGVVHRRKLTTPLHDVYIHVHSTCTSTSTDACI